MSRSKPSSTANNPARIWRRLKTTRRLFPWPLWLAGAALLAVGVLLTLSPGAAKQATNNQALTNEAVDGRVAVFEDFFSSAWRSGSTTAPTLVEATYCFPELVAALHDLPAKSSHQGEIADRLSILKANVDSLVFYLTFAQGADSIAALDPKSIVSVQDDQNNIYSVSSWSEANPALLPVTTTKQRIGLLAAAIKAANGRTLEQNNAQELRLIITGVSQSPQTLRWDLSLLKSFVEQYERR